MDHHGDEPRLESERGGGAGVVDLIDLLDLEEVIAGAEGSQLAAAALPRVLRQRVRVAAGEPAVRLDAGEIAAPAVSGRPRRALRGDLPELGR